MLGLAGEEENTIDRRVAPGRITRTDTRSVRPGGVLALRADELHAIRVVSPTPILHLHLYGVALDRLPPFSARSAFTIE